MPLAIADPDSFQYAQDAGADVNLHINGDEVSTVTSADTYKTLAQVVLTNSIVSSSPGTNLAWIVDHIKLFNTGTLTRIVTLYTNGAATANIWAKITLAAGESAEWTSAGWTLYDSLGIPKVALAEAPSKVIHLFTGTTTYTPSQGVRAMYVEAVGGGGGSGGVATAATNSGAAGGGGSGAYSTVYTTTVKATYIVAIGVGGTAGTAGANTGGVGGDTTFDSASICTAKGGLGGLGDTVAVIHVGGAGGAGGPAASGVGDVKTDGDSGDAGLALAAAQAIGGNGGRSRFGGGGPGRKNATGAGLVGGNYGGGAGGAAIISGGASQAGAAGAPGILRIWEFQ